MVLTGQQDVNRVLTVITAQGVNRLSTVC